MSIIDRLNASPRLLLVSDLDSTLVDHDDPRDISLLRFNSLWEAHHRRDSLLVFSTGRSPPSLRLLRAHKPLLTPDVAVMSVGTEIAYGGSMVADLAWREILSRRWDRNVVVEETSRFPELVPQPEIDQRPHKVSFFIDKLNALRIINVLSDRLEKRGLDVKIIYSSGTALDVLPQGAGKGQALAYLLKKFKIDGNSPGKTLVCGDSGNDADLFGVPQVYGVMVSNAQEELLQWHSENARNNPNIIHATERCASGILQAIGIFGLGPNVSPRDIKDFGKCKVEIVNPSYEVVKFYLFYERWRRAEIYKTKHNLQTIKSVFNSRGIFVHPSGTELTIHQCIDAMERLYGDSEGKQFKVWVDQVSSTQIGSNTWLVKCNKWDSFGLLAKQLFTLKVHALISFCEERRGCLTTIILSSKVEGEFIWLHIHQTWLDGSVVEDPETWLL